MSQWFLIAVQKVHAVDPLSVRIGQRVPQREALQLYGPFATEAAARQAGDGLRRVPGVVSVVMFQGDHL